MDVARKGGEADKEAQAREQYFFFRGEVETALSDLFRAENRLRYIMGLAATDGRLDRHQHRADHGPRRRSTGIEIHGEGVGPQRRASPAAVADQAARAGADGVQEPALAATGRGRLATAGWVLGDELIDADGRGYTAQGTDSIARHRRLLALWPTAISRSRSSACNSTCRSASAANWPRSASSSCCWPASGRFCRIRSSSCRTSWPTPSAMLDTSYTLMQTNFNRAVAAERQVEAVQSAYEAGTVTLDLLLDAQRRLADALSAGYRAQADYNRNIAQVHFRKGSLLEYNDVYLAEGPWPAKAYFDAHRRARARDAAYYLDYGFTRPDVDEPRPGR